MGRREEERNRKLQTMAWIVGGFSIGGFIIIAVIVMASIGNNRAKVDPPEVLPLEERMPIAEVSALFHENAAKARMKFGDGPIVFEMRVDRIDSSYGDRLIVIQEDNGLRSHYGAIFKGEFAPRLARYHPGSTLRGRGSLSHTMGGIVLDHCTLDD